MLVHPPKYFQWLNQQKELQDKSITNHACPECGELLTDEDLKNSVDGIFYCNKCFEKEKREFDQAQTIVID